MDENKKSYGDYVQEMGELKGFKLIHDMEMLKITHNIFSINYNCLCNAIDMFEQDIELCFLSNSSRRDAITLDIICLLHNYTASAFTLVNHSRKLKQKLNNENVNVFYENEVEKLKSIEVVIFMKDLRNYVQHRSFPICNRRINLQGAVDTNQGWMEHKVLLSREELLKWRKGSKSKWTSKSKKYINRFNSDIDIKLFCKEYYDIIVEFDRSFFEKVYKEYGNDIKEFIEFREQLIKLYPPPSKDNL
jgi:hypothetical protein